MCQRTNGCLAIAAAIGLSSLCGCGGAVSIGAAPQVTTPPTTMTLQPSTAVDSSTTNVTSYVAVKGAVISVGTDANSLNTISVGRKTYHLFTDLSAASLVTANYDYAVGTYGGGSFLWAYRAGRPAIPILSDSIDAVAKNADLFFDDVTDPNTGNQTANLLTVRGSNLIRTPYNLPMIDSGDTIFGVALNSSGLALIDESASLDFKSRGRKLTTDARRALIDRLIPKLKGDTRERLAQMNNRLRPTTTSTSPTGYYLVSTSGNPIPLGLPAAAVQGVLVFSINDAGISVGAAFVGDPNNPNIVPYYWDAQGNPHAMSLSSDLNFGFAEDINNEGTAVGEAGNDITSFGTMWAGVTSPDTNINSLLASTFGYDVQFVGSIGNDFTMAAGAVMKTNSTDTYFIGLQPH